MHAEPLRVSQELLLQRDAVSESPTDSQSARGVLRGADFGTWS